MPKDIIEQVQKVELAKHHILSVTYKDKFALYSAYMPFVKNGGLFIPTNTKYSIGDDLFLMIQLIDIPEKLAVAGQVIWYTPKGSDASHPKGIGVQLSEHDEMHVRDKIETFLAGMSESSHTTHTM